ncbi:MAG: O-antigen ligase family protein [Deltaproteobacteria bacterium]|nr:O-antigen ligase family protein [Deltaproteobacteria bacterium]
MFAIPGIAALTIFILARPQEFFPLLQRVPFLHLFTALAVLGWVIDVRLRRTQPVGTPVLPWAIAFLGWAILTVAAVVPDLMIGKTIEMVILFALYGTIAHGIQKWRTFQVYAAVLMSVMMFIALVCFHQGRSEKQCVGGQELDGEVAGKPDGRPCETNETCYGADGEPGLEYRCEYVGLFGTYSQEERVRYRGDMQDPNEVCIAIVAGGMSLLIAFLRRKKNPLVQFACVGGTIIVILTVLATQSRGGLVGVALVFGIYMYRRFGIWSIVPAIAAAMPLLLLGGRSGEKADMSTQLRYEAWATGLRMWKSSPIFGVGAGQFNEHHFLTAHNSFVLTLAEMGLPGMVLFICLIYLTIKSLIVGLRELAKVPGSQVAQVWGWALLASWAVILFQINTLSYAYKSVLWIFFGLVGAWAGCIRTHHPGFSVKLTWRDLLIIVTGSLIYVLVFLPIFLKAKGEM